jgi:hypothetical protein
VNHRFLVGAVAKALNDDPRPGARRKLDGRGEAHLIAITCREPPDEHDHWALRVLADRLVELGVVDSISHEAVRQALKKNKIKAWQEQMWCLPSASAAFVAAMEQVLDVYVQAYDPKHPKVCFDESSKQLIEQMRLPVQVGKVRRVNYEYQRNGTRNLFIFFEPLADWRHIEVTERRTAQDFAHQMRWLVDVHYPDAEYVEVILDNLNTHKLASLYETFAPVEAYRIARRLRFHFTPKHGSWLNMAEIEFSVLMRKLGSHVPNAASLNRKVAALQSSRNDAHATVRWHFTANDARICLAQLYPSIPDRLTTRHFLTVPCHATASPM